MRRNRGTVTKDKARGRYKQDWRRTKLHLDSTGVPRNKTVDEALIRHIWLALARVSIQALFVLQNVGNHWFCTAGLVELPAEGLLGPVSQSCLDSLPCVGSWSHSVLMAEAWAQVRPCTVSWLWASCVAAADLSHSLGYMHTDAVRLQKTCAT